MCLTRLPARRLYHLRAKIFDRAKLKLLDGSFRFTYRLRDFPDAFFFGESHLNYATLFGRQSFHEAEYVRRLLDLFKVHVRVAR
jgi:hypothetical protein